MCVTPVIFQELKQTHRCTHALKNSALLIKIENKAHQLFCSDVISSIKSFNVKRHYKIHSAKCYCYKRESNKIKLELLKSARNKQANMFRECSESKFRSQPQCFISAKCLLSEVRILQSRHIGLSMVANPKKNE